MTARSVAGIRLECVDGVWTGERECGDRAAVWTLRVTLMRNSVTHYTAVYVNRVTGSTATALRDDDGENEFTCCDADTVFRLLEAGRHLDDAGIIPEEFKPHDLSFWH